jgi:hypothetical protein
MVTQSELQDLMSTGLKTYFHDPFLGTEMIDTATTQTAVALKHVGQVIASTGVQQDSESRVNYERAFFNPRYSVLRFKARTNSMADCFAFFGFKSTLTAPTWHMTESHAGFMIYQGTLYAVTGGSLKDNPPDVVDYQATPIMDINTADWHVYEIEFNRFRYYTTPYTVPYFDKDVLPKLKQGLTRKWSGKYVNGSVLPEDKMHYIVFYIKNSVGATKYIELQHVNYAEVYPD